MVHNERSIALARESIRYSDSGSGPVLVFVHGAFVNGLLWRKAVALLEPRFRCVVPTLALGAHEVVMSEAASRTPRGQAHLIAELLAALDLRDVTVVGNDSGGALCQLLIAHHPERIARVVLTNCDSFERFPPRVLLPLYRAARIPGFVALVAQLLRVPALQRAFAATVAVNVPEPPVLEAFFHPLRRQRGVRRDLAAFLTTVSARELVAAASAFAAFSGRVLIVWGKRDLFFPLRDARRLTAAFRDAMLVEVAGSRTFVPEDAPMALAESIERFVAATAAPV